MAGSQDGRKANKTVLADKIAERLNLPRRTAMMVMNGVLDSIEDCIFDPKHQGVAIKGFGTFLAAIRKGRAYKHPLTGASIDVPDKPTVKFKPSDGLLARFEFSPNTGVSEGEVSDGTGEDRSPTAENLPAGSPFGSSAGTSYLG
jgi:nucleoid DNA-binding protein